MKIRQYQFNAHWGYESVSQVITLEFSDLCDNKDIEHLVNDAYTKWLMCQVECDYKLIIGD